MKTKLVKIILSLFMGIGTVTVADDDIDMLLNTIAKTSDLSEKTKLANGGVSFIWTRDDLNRMQITNLKQILKTMYPFGYDENRYGLVDPITYQSNQPFRSSIIRLYIDNQEITTGLYGSGVFLMGDANIDWVDHVEIYTQNPTYEYATESTITLIKLYTKSVVKDEGSVIKIAGGSYGTSTINGYSAGWIKDWSYFIFALAANNKREKYYSHATQLSRDKKVNSVIATLHKDNTNILLNAFEQNRDGFMDVSLDATPTKSDLYANYCHIGVDSTLGNFSYLLTYSYTQTKADMSDDVIPIPAPPYNGLFPIASAQSFTHSIVLTGELKYRYKSKKNLLLSGLKYRTKQARWDKSNINGFNMAVEDDKRVQNIYTAYVENQHFFNRNSMITAGLEIQRVENKDTIQNDNLFMYRLGHTYTNDAWTFKTFYSHTLFTLEPYLVNSQTYLAHPQEYYKPASVDSFIENVIWEKEQNKYEVVLDYTFGKNFFLPSENGKIVNYKQTLKMLGADFRWTHYYHNFDKLFLRYGYRDMQNTPYFTNIKQNLCVVRNVNTFNKFDIFNELIYDRDSISKKNFYNYTLGIQYNHSDSFTVGLKGINLFNRARTSSYVRINPNTFQQEEELNISPIDKEIRLSAEWVF